ncbi:MAG TPA: Uma2 family endonuclease [Nostocaceae cyanobacterium]|nr:Uma2 family endonuclease [Nostocaceae cyanobacterium]
MPEIELPPTQAELPCDDGIPMETQRHKYQMDLLIETLQPWLNQRSDGYVGGNMFVYYSLAQVKNKDFKGPDVFVVVDVPKKERLCWVVWEEGKPPDVVIELMSESTSKYDKNEKKQIYQNKMRVSEYFWFDPFKPDDFAGFYLKSGAYEPIQPNNQNLIVSDVLGLGLVRWEGQYRDVNTTWLRWATLEGELLPTEREITEQEKQRAEQAESKLKQVAVNLLQNGMSLEQVVNITGLAVEEVEKLIN